MHDPEGSNICSNELTEGPPDPVPIAIGSVESYLNQITSTK